MNWYVAKWLRTHAPRVRPQSLTTYESYLRNHILPRFGDRGIADVTRADVRAFRAELELNLTAGTTVAVLKLLRTIMEAAVDDDVIEFNPAQGATRALRVGRGTPMPRHHFEQLVALWESDVDAPLARLFLVMARTGLRVGEALGLQWADYDATAGQLYVSRQWLERAVPYTKTGEHRVLNLSVKTADLLDTAPRTHPSWRWANPRTQVPWSRQGVGKRLARACDAATVPRYTCHTLRHTYATLLIESGVDLRYIQQQLGHRSIAQTEHYTRFAVSPRDPRADALDSLASVQRHGPLPAALRGDVQIRRVSGGRRRGG